MKYLRYGLIALGLLCASQAEAATCFAVGTNLNPTWSTSNLVMWASSSGGTASTCAATGGVPKNVGDVATFDGSSGGGTVTVDSTINGITIAQITMGAFTGTLDFSVNNPSLTLTSTFSITGSGTRTLKLGSGTFTLTNANGTVFDATTTTGLTFNAGASTLLSAGAGTSGGGRALVMNSLTYAIVTLNALSSFQQENISITGSPTIGTLNINGPQKVTLGAAATVTATTLNISGTSSSNAVSLNGAGTSGSTISVASGTPTITWSAIYTMNFTGGATFTATNSFDLKGNSGITINGPGGGGGHIIGG